MGVEMGIAVRNEVRPRKMDQIGMEADVTDPAQAEIIRVENVSKRFEQTYTLEDVSFLVRPGEVFALLGPNGAGKTTMANLLLGNHAPDAGKITFYTNGHEENQLSDREVGYFPGDSLVYRTLPIGRILFHTATRRGMSEAEARSVTDYWLHRLDLTHRANTSLSNLSRGNQQKVQFAEAALHRPKIIFLDEPFVSLDPVNQEMFIEMIRELQATGITFILSDHHMALVERLANFICILNRGRVIAQGNLEDLRRQADVGIRVRIRLVDPGVSVDMEALQSLSVIRTAERTANGEIRLLTTGNAVPIDVLNFAKTYLRVSEILSEPPSLHDIYIHFIQQNEKLAA